MPMVPTSPQPKRKPMPIPDSKYLMMAMANMHNAGRIQVGPQATPEGAKPDGSSISAAMESMK